MSALSEIDLRDWDMPDFKELKILMDDRPTSLNDDLYQWALDCEERVREFIEIVELIKEKQIQQFQKRVPAILRKGEE